MSTSRSGRLDVAHARLVLKEPTLRAVVSREVMRRESARAVVWSGLEEGATRAPEGGCVEGVARPAAYVTGTCSAPTHAHAQVV